MTLEEIDCAITELLAKQRICECLALYCRGVDRCDQDLIRSVFWTESTVDYGRFKGTGHEFADAVVVSLSRMDQTQHMLGNILIELDGETAAVETYVHCYHRPRGADGAPIDVIVGGRYLDIMSYRAGEWRIQRRKMIFDWIQEGPSRTWEGSFFGGIGGIPMVSGQTLGARKPDDALYSFMP